MHYEWLSGWDLSRFRRRWSGMVCIPWYVFYLLLLAFTPGRSILIHATRTFRALELSRVTERLSLCTGKGHYTPWAVQHTRQAVFSYTSFLHITLSKSSSAKAPNLTQSFLTLRQQTNTPLNIVLSCKLRGMNQIRRYTQVIHNNTTNTAFFHALINKRSNLNYNQLHSHCHSVTVQ